MTRTKDSMSFGEKTPFDKDKLPSTVRDSLPLHGLDLEENQNGNNAHCMR